MSSNKEVEDGYSEITLTTDTSNIGNFHHVNLADNELWLLQCPKGMDLTKFESEKLKIPGRTILKEKDYISIEFTEHREEAFVYLSRKSSKYSLRMLPIKGTMVIRDHLKGTKLIEAEHIKEKLHAKRRVPYPRDIRVRHPLLGSNYDNKIVIKSDIKQCLDEADRISAELLHNSMFSQRISKKHNGSFNRQLIESTKKVIKDEPVD